jgi:hypothetical protein
MRPDEWIDEEGVDTSGTCMEWREEDWFNLYWIVDVIKSRLGISRGVAERTLRELCASGDVRSIKYQVTDPDIEDEPEIIKPSEWVKDQVDLTVGDWVWVFVSGDDVEYWVNKPGQAPLKLKQTLEEWLADVPLRAGTVVPMVRTSRKQGLVRQAIKHLWPDGIPEALTNPQIEKQIGDWIINHCKKNNLPKPEISRDTILRAAGRKH